MKICEYAGDVFGKWKAFKRDAARRPSDWDELEEFDFSEKFAIEAMKREIAKRHGLRPEDVFLYNAEDDEGMEEGVLNQINGGKRRIRRKVNVSQRGK